MFAIEITNSYIQSLRKDSAAVPFLKHIGMEIDRLEPGDVIIRLPIKKELLNTNGYLDGGVLTTFNLAPSWCCVTSISFLCSMTISLTTQYITPVKEGTLYASATLINHGRRTQYIESKVTNEQGEIIGTALATFTILKN